jgi:hypothetical protein
VIRRFIALAVLPVGLLAAQPGTTPTVAQILARMQRDRMGLVSFQVPVEIKARLKKGISLPIRLSGTRYFKAPDTEALKLRTVPAIAKQFQNLYSSLGTPATWGSTYDVTSITPMSIDGHDVYEARAVYKRPSNVDHILLDIDRTTYAPVHARWFYKNGATIDMAIEEQRVGAYELPRHESLELRFPGYAGSADIEYGTYIINQPIPSLSK